MSIIETEGTPRRSDVTEIHVRKQAEVSRNTNERREGNDNVGNASRAEVQRRRGDEGFTLIELLVVIVILAILAAIVVFAVGGITDKGQTSACDTDLKTIQTAEEAYFAAQGTTAGSGVWLEPAARGRRVPHAVRRHFTTVDTLPNTDGQQYVVTPTDHNTAQHPLDYTSPAHL